MTEDEYRLFTTGTWVYPHPIALSCARIIRSRSEETLVDALLKGAEILTRYLAAVSLASYSVRADVAEKPPMIADLTGHLAFGHFLSITQNVARLECEHPAKACLKSGFAIDKDDDIQSTDQALLKLLELRNTLGHDLNSITRPRAISILSEYSPQTLMATAINGIQRLLQLPLFIIENLSYSKGTLIGQRLTLMGDSADPQPENAEVTGSIKGDGEPYIGFHESVCVQAPMLVWRVSHETANYRLFIFDTIKPDIIEYKAVEVSRYESQETESKDFHAILQGDTQHTESLTLADGRTFKQEWLQKRKTLESASDNLQGRVPWESFSPDTLKWYASKLVTEVSALTPEKIIQSQLLDERDTLTTIEQNQLQILFGTDVSVKKLLGRNMIDLRAVFTEGVRWDERIESHSNVIECLRTSVEFFSRHVGVDGVTVDGLKATSGSADYLAMREALINLFIHQDFTDQTAAAQVEIQPEKVVCFNPGRSLANEKALREGGKSQCRNPLIARALRLIGFAELAGSGLRQIRHVWRTNRRRPELIESSTATNTFSLTLDWRIIPDNYNELWKDRLGVKLKEEEATILNLSVDGLSVEQAASATGLSLESAQEAIDTLVKQSLVDEKKKRFYLKSHLRELVEAASDD